MNIEKLTPQVIAFAKIFRVLTDASEHVSVNDFSQATMNPYRGFTLLYLRMRRSSQITEAMDKMIAELMDEININDWEGLFERPLPLQLQGVWQIAYIKGIEKTKLAAMRKKFCLTQAQLAEMIGASKKDISRWEEENIKPTEETLTKIAAALKCEINELI